MTMSGSEFSAFYYDKIYENTVGIAGASLDFTSAGIVYVPYARLNYSFGNEFRIQGRYKWKLWDYSQIGTDGNNYHSKIQQFDIWRKMESNAQPQFDNDDVNYLHNIRVLYKYKTQGGQLWRPFVEVGYVKVSRTTDERQTRLRVGIKYTL